MDQVQISELESPLLLPCDASDLPELESLLGWIGWIGWIGFRYPKSLSGIDSVGWLGLE